jgi:hypothetical protein
MLIKAKCGTREFAIDSHHVAYIVRDISTGGIQLRTATGAELLSFAPNSYNCLSAEECERIIRDYEVWCDA